MKHLLQPLMQLQSKTVRMLASQSNLVAASIEDDDDDDDDDDDVDGGAGAARIKKKGKKKGTKKVKNKPKKDSAAIIKWPGKLVYAKSLHKSGGKDIHLFAAVGTTKICPLFNFSCGCSKSSCDDSHHCAFCGEEDHGIRDCPTK